MKKYINNKVYDTTTAKKVAEWDNGIYGNDFRWCQEDLYQKKTGEFFIHGQGGAMSKYSVSRGNNWSSGEELIPISYGMAKEWAEEFLTGDEYEGIFGVVEEEDKKSVNLYISFKAHDKLRQISAQSGQPMSVLVEDMILKL